MPATLPLRQRAQLRDDGPCGWPAGGPVVTLLLDDDDLRDRAERLGAEAADHAVATLADRLQERLSPLGVTTHLCADHRGIRCEGLDPHDPLAAEVGHALREPLQVGAEVIEVRVA
jgi:hypothetical protein